MQNLVFLSWAFWVFCLYHLTGVFSRRDLRLLLPASNPSPAPAPAPTPSPFLLPPPPPSNSGNRYKISSVSAPISPPFFPSYTAAPPPPPPTRFISFPANISTLVVPHSSNPKPSSGKVTAAVLSVVIIVIILAGFAFFLHRRRKGERRKFISDSEDGDVEAYTLQNAETTRDTNMYRVGGSNSTSQFLYLGNVVNPEVVEVSSGTGSGSASCKHSSPELHPLPPLPRKQCEGLLEEAEEREDQEEEFYSPMASLCGRESTIGEPDFPAQKSEPSESGNYSRSSSSSSSPARSSFPGTSPHRSKARSLECRSISARNSESSRSMSDGSNRNVPSPTLSLPSTSPDLSFVKKAELGFDQITRSSVSSFSTSPERRILTQKQNGDGSLRIFSYVRRHKPSPFISSATVTPLGGYLETPNAYIQPSSLISSASTSPDRGLRKTLDQSPPNLHYPGREVRSVLLSLASSSSQRINAGDDKEQSWKDSSLESSSLKRSASAPPRRPPPPPPVTRRHGNYQSTAGLPVQPPPLVPPSRPFMGQKNPKIVFNTETPTAEGEEILGGRKGRAFSWERGNWNSGSGTWWGHHLRSSSYV